MSKFGAHISIGRRDGFGAALQQCHDAGSPVSVLFALDQNVMPDVIAHSPSTKLIFRTQIGGDPNPPNIWQGEPVVAADNWYNYRKPTWLHNPAHYYCASNEPDPGTLTQFAWLNKFEFHLMHRANADGLKLAIGAHSTGTPSDDGGVSRYQRWNELVPSLQYAKAHGHILLLHEYGFDTILPQSAPHHALRFRDALDYLAPLSADPQVVISECSDFNGYSGEGASWLNGVEWYDQQVISDPRVLGFCGYQLGGAENWYSLISQWADWVSAHPTPVIEPPPPPPPEVIITEHFFTAIVTQDDDAAAAIEFALDTFRIPARHYTRRVA